jgi:sugar-specific transcriptional regulator TrmB
MGVREVKIYLTLLVTINKISEKAGIPRKRVQIIETGEIFNSLHD